jgi:sugar/nucleoside kinase (ribokinase family)
MPALCLGEAIVDLVCERPARSWDDADAFVPHFGGAVANVAVVAARLAADMALAGGAGDDPWGHWLRARLEREGVDLRWFSLVPGPATPVAFVLIDPAGEPSYQIYGEGIEATIRSAGPALPDAVATSDAFFFSSNTLAGGDARALTLDARERALASGRPVCFDPNLRLHRWRDLDDAVRACRECLDGALLVRCNREEARLLTGDEDPDTAACALVAAGARVAVVTLGPEGAVARGEVTADVPGRSARAISTIGAGDTLMGTLLGRLALAGWDPAAIGEALPKAVDAAARATERWGALE